MKLVNISMYLLASTTYYVVRYYLDPMDKQLVAKV